jgi:NADPH-dependent 2,4-dienoyl-CoA reductase/sulfur reductase-like enzyme
LSADIVIVGAGVRPNTKIAAGAGVSTGIAGAVVVNERMETNVSGLLAAGDCVETWHALLERPTYLPLGTTAHKQGRVAGENAAGGRASFRGSLGTQVVKVFELAAARTGLSDAEARAAGFFPVTVETSVPDHKRYYPGATELRIRITGDAGTRRLLGAQIVGHWQAEVAKRIDIAAIALLERLTVADLTRLDLSYTPPLGSPWDPVQVAADAWDNAVPIGRG